MVVGFFSTAVISALEGAVAVSGLSGLGAALYRIGFPEDCIVAFKVDDSAENFLVLAKGPVEEMARGKTLYSTFKLSRIDQSALAFAA